VGKIMDIKEKLMNLSKKKILELTNEESDWNEEKCEKVLMSIVEKVKSGAEDEKRSIEDELEKSIEKYSHLLDF
jgi:hypothetical protein